MSDGEMWNAMTSQDLLAVSPIEEWVGGRAFVDASAAFRAPVWKVFLVTMDRNQAMCRVCRKVSRCFGGGTSQLRRHVLRWHPEMAVKAGIHPEPK
ncbi:hypothetical protein BIW11_05959 [Tropilaelaps mercedesae]|uniref:BED-type domain-containing protein n=1 Tax=Tropilaelaps mercedesae TaxID=418985 RepID=A0A1V9Y046_9ACAR|nr:hypothetical protein BIW11_05959 [Tropilaelaps mercedesae]